MQILRGEQVLRRVNHFVHLETQMYDYGIDLTLEQVYIGAKGVRFWWLGAV